MYASALHDHPTDLTLRTKVAEVLRLLGRNDQAVALYSSVAWAHGVAGHLGQAIIICKLILELAPDHSATQEMLARLCACREIREQKHAVPVRNVGGRWVADPSGAADASPQALAPIGMNLFGAATTDEALRPGEISAARRDNLGPPLGGMTTGGETDGESFPQQDAAASAGEAPAEAPCAVIRATPDGMVAVSEEQLPPAEAASDDGAGQQWTPPAQPPDDPDEEDEDWKAAPRPSDSEVSLVMAWPARQILPPTPDPSHADALPSLADASQSSRRRHRATERGFVAVAPFFGAPPEESPATVPPPHLASSGPSEALVFPASTDDEAGAPPSPTASAPPPGSLDGRLSPSEFAGRQKPTAPMDSLTQGTLLRKDAEQAFIERQAPSATCYAEIERQVRHAGWEQALNEVEEDEAERTETDLQDTLKDPSVDLATPTETAEARPKIFPLFSDLDTSAFLALIRRLDRRVYAADTLVCREGDPGDCLYLVGAGRLQVMKESDTGEQIRLALLGPGSFFGEFGLLTDGRRHASVRCVEECELLELRRSELEALCGEHPSISWTLRTFYQQRVMAMVMATSPVFQAVSPEERKSVLARFTVRRFMAGEKIIEEGRPGTGFYVILVGCASVRHRVPDGTQVDLSILREGDYFGEMSLLSGATAQATVRAESITEVLVLAPQDFYDLAADHPEIWAVVQGEAERRRQDTAEQLAYWAKGGSQVCLI
jgi:CRP-like cAMP-binding protein